MRLWLGTVRASTILRSVEVIGDAGPFHQGVVKVAHNALQNGVILETVETVVELTRALLADVVAVEEVPVRAGFALAGRYADLAVFNDVVAQIAQDAVSL